IAVLIGREQGYQNPISFAFSLDRSRIVTTEGIDGPVRIWDVSSGAMLNVLETRAYSAALSSNGKFIATMGSRDGSDHGAYIWEAATGKPVIVLRGHKGGVQSAAFSRDGRRIVTASNDETARIWDIATAQEIAILRGHEQGLFSVALSPDGSRIATGS